MNSPIEITDNAAAQIQALMDKAPEGTQGVRLNVKPTGCSGNSYVMEYIKADENILGDDKFDKDSVSLYIPKMHSWMLFGMRVDYAMDDLGNSKFEFSNPNETGRCGCGESFHVSMEELQKRKAEETSGSTI